MTHHAPHHHIKARTTNPDEAHRIAKKKMLVIVISIIILTVLRTIFTHYYEPLANYLDIADHAALVADISFMFSE